jgi:hypothetical protein
MQEIIYRGVAKNGNNGKLVDTIKAVIAELQVPKP